MTENSASGLTGTLKMLVTIAILVAAGVGVMLVFDVIPREVIGEWASKAALAVCIIALAAGALFLVGRAGK